MVAGLKDGTLLHDLHHIISCYDFDEGIMHSHLSETLLFILDLNFILKSMHFRVRS